MDLLQLNQFRVLAREQHMTRAAEALYIAQPSLSKTIKRLESELGAPLFDRPGRQIHLNRFGQAFLEYVDQAFSALDEGRRKIREMTELATGEVSLAAPALHWLPDILHQFRAEHPNATFRLLQRHSSEMQRLLETAQVDFAVTSTPLASPQMRWRRLLTEEIYLAAPRFHRLAGRESVSLSEVAAEPVVASQRGDIVRNLIDDTCHEAGFAPRIVCEADEAAVIHDFVEAGLGVAFLPALLHKQKGDCNLAWIRLTEPQLHLTLGLAWHEKHHLSGAAQSFREFLIEYFKK